MEVLMAREVGFCFGVKRAITLAEDVLASRDNVFILGDLIHNRAVAQRLEAGGLRSVESIEGERGGTMVVRAHGLPVTEIERAAAAGLEVVDATCPIVRKAQASAQSLEDEGRQVVVVGDADHPEIRGILGNLKGLAPHLVVDSVADVHAAHHDGKIQSRVGVIFQTTHVPEDCQAVVDALEGVAEDVCVINTICKPVRKRQEDAVQLAGRADVMLVVGSAKSANTMELKHLLEARNPKTLHIEHAGQLDLSRFRGDEVVGIASGLSTPEDVVEGVRARLIEAFPPGA